MRYEAPCKMNRSSCACSTQNHLDARSPSPSIPGLWQELSAFRCRAGHGLAAYPFRCFRISPPGPKRRIKVHIGVPRGHGQCDAFLLVLALALATRRMPMEIAKRISKLGLLE